MPTNILKSCIDIVIPHVKGVLNHSLATGNVPDCFKHAIIKPLIKKPSLDCNEFANFRPVSNLQFLSKVLEKIVLKPENINLLTRNFT